MMEKIGAELRAQREFVGVTAREMCQIAGCAVQTLRRIEEGRRDLPLSQLMTMLDALGLTVSDFFMIVEGYGTAEDVRDLQKIKRAESKARRESEKLREEVKKLKRKRPTVEHQKLQRKYATLKRRIESLAKAVQ